MNWSTTVLSSHLRVLMNQTVSEILSDLNTNCTKQTEDTWKLQLDALTTWTPRSCPIENRNFIRVQTLTIQDKSYRKYWHLSSTYCDSYYIVSPLYDHPYNSAVKYNRSKITWWSLYNWTGKSEVLQWFYSHSAARCRPTVCVQQTSFPVSIHTLSSGNTIMHQKDFCLLIATRWRRRQGDEWRCWEEDNHWQTLC